MKEIWEDIIGYEGYYQISNFGRVKSLERTIFRKNGKKYNVKERIVKYDITNNGYKMVYLTKDGLRKNLTIHRLVASTFIKNIKNKPIVNHIDGDKLNNSIDNLEWCSYKENSNHAISVGLSNVRGSSNGNSRLKEEDIIKIRNLYYIDGYNQVDISNIYNVHRTTINKIICKKNWFWID